MELIFMIDYDMILPGSFQSIMLKLILYQACSSYLEIAMVRYSLDTSAADRAPLH